MNSGSLFEQQLEIILRDPLVSLSALLRHNIMIAKSTDKLTMQ